MTSAHPTVHIDFQYASESNRGPYPFGADTPIEGGQNAGGDRHALMVNSNTCTLYELWDARYALPTRTAGSGAIWNLHSNALRPAGRTSADAAGLPILPGLLNYAQVQQAARTGTPITHAIRFTAQVTRAVATSGRPATREQRPQHRRAADGRAVPAEAELQRRRLLPRTRRRTAPTPRPSWSRCSTTA